MKMYEKKSLTYKNGLLIADDGEVVNPGADVVAMALSLETKIQKAQYLKAQPAGAPMPTLDGFERKSEKEIELFECETPLMDKKVEDSIAFMEELDNVHVTGKLNDELKGYAPLVEFCIEDTVVSVDAPVAHRFDCPTMGSPLEWDKDKIMEFVAMANGVELEDSESEE